MSDIKETPQQTIDRLTAELAKANKKIEAFTAAQTQASADEVIIREKMAHGLTREQAIEVIKNQRRHDEAEAAATKKSTK
jgi:Spy/CpxP family protein refolding chaperone